MNFSCKVILNTLEPGKNGKALLYLQAFINGERSKKSIQLSVDPNHFDGDTGLVKESHPDASDINLIIRSKISKANDIAKKYRLMEALTEERVFTKEIFEREYARSSNPKGDFLTFYRDRMNYRYTQKKVEYNTFKNDRVTYRKLKEFKYFLLKKKPTQHELIKEERVMIRFSELNSKFMDKFNNWMIVHKKNNQNTRWTEFKNIHSYLEIATEEGYFQGDPLKEIDLQFTQGATVFLEQSEVHSLINYYYNPGIIPNHKFVLKYFLYACFTGLRISDIKNIKVENLIGEILVFIATKNKKQGKFVRIPLSKRADEFMQGEILNKQEHNHIFDTFEDSTTNKFLKEIAAKTGITKRLTFHVARHTFATIYLELGGKLQVLQRYLGHSKITTTMRYVHVTDRVSVEEISRFDSF